MKTKKRLRFHRYVVIHACMRAIILLLLGSCGETSAQESKDGAVGLLWGTPEAPCDVADLGGRINLLRSLGLLKVDKYTYLPVKYAFNSSSERVDPLLGYGWSLLFANSRIVLLDEDVFELTNIDGKKIKLTRDKKDQNMLHGCGVNGQIKSNQIVVKYNNDWSFTYTKGTLSSIQTPTKHTLRFRYDSDKRLIDVADGDNELLHCSYETGASSITINSTKYMVGMTKRPLLIGVQGGVPHERYEPSLSSVREEHCEPSEEYGYTNYVNSEFGMFVRTFENRLLTWNADSRKIVRDGDSLVKILTDPNKVSWFTVEYWSNNKLVYSKMRDTVNGIYRETNRDQSSNTFETFTSGVLAGKERKVTHIAPDGNIEKIKYNYDEVGNLLRAVHSRE